MTSLTARSIGSGCGYRAYMSAIVAQHVWTTWVCSCSTHAATSQLCHQSAHVRRRPSQTRRVHGRKWRKTHLIALAPAAVRALLADEEVARLARVLAVLVRLADERERLERELRRVGEAYPPRAEPGAFRSLDLMEVVDSLRDRPPRWIPL